MFGHPVDVKSMHYLFYTLRGIRRIQANNAQRPPQKPSCAPIDNERFLDLFALLRQGQGHVAQLERYCIFWPAPHF